MGCLKIKIFLLFLMIGSFGFAQTTETRVIHVTHEEIFYNPNTGVVLKVKQDIDFSNQTNFLPNTTTLASTSEYDVLDRSTQVTLNDGSVTKTAYSFGASPQGQTQYKVSVTDANNTTSHSFTDVKGRTVATLSPSPTSGTITTQYTYDALSQLLEVIDTNGNKIVSVYDNLGRRLSINHPDAGLSSLVYDLAGNLLSKQTPNTKNLNDSKINYYYDFHRLKKITYPYNWQNTVEYHYGLPNALFNRVGRLQLITDASGGQELKYDALGNISEQLRTVMIDPSKIYAYKTQYEYDSWGRVQQMIYPDTEKMSYAYNVAGNLTGIKGEKLGNSQPYISFIGYDLFEQKVYQKLGNGTETTYNYEADRRRLQVMKVTSPFNKQTLINNNYAYDKLSNVLQVENTAVPGVGQLGGSGKNSYSYDILNRLVSATGTFDGNGTQANFVLNMQYDNLHNIKNKQLEQNHSVNAQIKYNNAYSYGKTPHAVTQAGSDKFSYDANGNQTYHNKANGTYMQYKWDEENRLMASDNFGLVALYSYDASGERVIKSSANDTKTVFINGAPAGYTYHNANYTAYVGGHFVVNEGRFTKHYFNGAERLASKIGVGTLDNSWAKGYYQAGGLDYAKRYADAYADFKQIAKDKGLPPGPPNLKFIYAQEELAKERAKSELVADLTIMNTISLKEWEAVNKDKDPGPPVCVEITCIGNGGGIGVVSPTLPENEIYFFHPDHLGSTSYITNIQGETVQFNSYLPFGEDFVSQQRTTSVSAFLFNGKEKDVETSNSYFGARYYNSYTSNWLSVDAPLINGHYLNGNHDGGVFNSFNLSAYGYCRQSPVVMIDPDGNQTFYMNTRSFSPVSSFGGLWGIAPSWKGDNRGYTTNPDPESVTYRIGAKATINMDNMTASAKPMKAADTHNNLTGNTTPSPSAVKGFFKKIDDDILKVFVHNEGNNAAADGSFDVDVKSNIYYTKESIKGGGSLITIKGNVYGDKFPSNETYISDNFGNALMLGTSGPKNDPEIGPYLLGGDKNIPMSNFNVSVEFDKNGKIIKATNNETKKPIKIDNWNNK